MQQILVSVHGETEEGWVSGRVCGVYNVAGEWACVYVYSGTTRQRTKEVVCLFGGFVF